VTIVFYVHSKIRKRNNSNLVENIPPDSSSLVYSMTAGDPVFRLEYPTSDKR